MAIAEPTFAQKVQNTSYAFSGGKNPAGKFVTLPFPTEDSPECAAIWAFLEMNFDLNEDRRVFNVKANGDVHVGVTLLNGTRYHSIWKKTSVVKGVPHGIWQGLKKLSTL